MTKTELHACIGRALQLGADPGQRDKLRDLVLTIEDKGRRELHPELATILAEGALELLIDEDAFRPVPPGAHAALVKKLAAQFVEDAQRSQESEES